MGLPAGMLNLIIGFSIVLGAAECFFGYRIFKVILGVVGFFLGAALAGSIGIALSGEEGVAILAGLVGGVAGAVLMVLFFFIGVFLIGAGLGAFTAVLLSLTSHGGPEPAILIILAVIGGVVALLFQKFMIVLSTAFGGAWSVVMGIAYLAGQIDYGGRAFTFADPTLFLRSAGRALSVILIASLALGLIGFVVQYRMLPASDGGRLARAGA